jgi:fluoroacetyl-CoA thioesterase
MTPHIRKESCMNTSLCVGLTLVRHVTVDRGRTIGFMGEDARVYATPHLVGDIEYACRDLIAEHTDRGEDSVGIAVAVRHLAPTLPGMTVEITVKITAIEGRQVTFEATARDDLEPIGTGTHTRFVVDVAKTVERLRAKAARRASGTA